MVHLLPLDFELPPQNLASQPDLLRLKGGQKVYYYFHVKRIYHIILSIILLSNN